MNDLYRAEPLVEWFPRPDGTERAVIFEPGYNDTEPRRYGKRGMGIKWMIRGPRGAACFSINTGWVPGVKGIPFQLADYYPSGTDLGYHARVPQWEGQEDYARDDCPYIGGRCYYDGSGLAAEPILERFIREGESVIWAALEERYTEIRTGEDADADGCMIEPTLPRAARPEEAVCAARCKPDGFWCCTAPRGHGGHHAVWQGDIAIATWPQEEDATDGE